MPCTPVQRCIEFEVYHSPNLAHATSFIGRSYGSPSWRTARDSARAGTRQLFERHSIQCDAFITAVVTAGSICGTLIGGQACRHTGWETRWRSVPRGRCFRRPWLREASEDRERPWPAYKNVLPFYSEISSNLLVPPHTPYLHLSLVQDNLDHHMIHYLVRPPTYNIIARDVKYVLCYHYAPTLYPIWSLKPPATLLQTLMTHEGVYSKYKSLPKRMAQSFRKIVEQGSRFHLQNASQNKLEQLFSQ